MIAKCPGCEKPTPFEYDYHAVGVHQCGSCRKFYRIMDDGEGGVEIDFEREPPPRHSSETSYVRLIRRGSQVICYISPDGNHWTETVKGAVAAGDFDINMELAAPALLSDARQQVEELDMLLDQLSVLRPTGLVDAIAAALRRQLRRVE